MNINEFANLILDGVHPVIEFRKGIKDIESYAELGMRTRVIDVALTSDKNIRIKVDYSEFEKFNKEFEQSNYYDKKGNPTLAAHEAGYYKPVDSFLFEAQDDADTYFGVVEDVSMKLYDRYKASDRSLSYVQWLEHFAARQIGI